MSGALPDATLPNVAAGPDPFTFEQYVEETGADALLILLQRDYHCTNCRKQVRRIRDRYDEFRERGAAVVSVVPDPPEQVAAWQADYDLPYPLLADPEATMGEAYDQPVRFGFLGEWSDFLGRMPEAILVDLRGDPEIAWTHRGSSTFDRPSVDDMLAEIDALLER